jgi:hypothetical protein
MTKKKTQIYPVIEMSHWRVDGSDNLDLKPDQDYSDFAIEIFKKNGIEHIEELDSHAYSSIKISDINDDDLKILIEKELEDAEISANGTEIVGPFEGGMVIISENGAVINHKCCGSIADYQNWIEILEEKPKSWKQIWIGHPWIYARINDNVLQLSNYTEHTGALETELSVLMEIDLEEFSQAFERAVNELKDFKQRVRAILTIEMSDLAEELSEILIENKYR